MTDEKLNTVKKDDAPFFQIRRNDDDVFLSRDIIVKIIAYGLCIALIILGAMFNIVALSIIGMTVLVILTVTIILFSIRNRTIRESETNQYIEDELETFKNDFVHTLYSYDLNYTNQDINEAMENYEEKLKQETASISDMDKSDLQFLVDTLKKDKTSSKKAKNKGKFDQTKQEPGFLKK